MIKYVFFFCYTRLIFPLIYNSCLFLYFFFPIRVFLCSLLLDARRGFFFLSSQRYVKKVWILCTCILFHAIFRFLLLLPLLHAAFFRFLHFVCSPSSSTRLFVYCSLLYFTSSSSFSTSIVFPFFFISSVHFHSSTRISSFPLFIVSDVLSFILLFILFHHVLFFSLMQAYVFLMYVFPFSFCIRHVTYFLHKVSVTFVFLLTCTSFPFLGYYLEDETERGRKTRKIKQSKNA